MTRIHWRTMTGATGHGEWLENDLAKAWFLHLRAESRDVKHWLVTRGEALVCLTSPLPAIEEVQP